MLKDPFRIVVPEFDESVYGIVESVPGIVESVSGIDVSGSRIGISFSGMCEFLNVIAFPGLSCSKMVICFLKTQLQSYNLHSNS